VTLVARRYVVPMRGVTEVIESTLRTIAMPAGEHNHGLDVDPKVIVPPK
jgi:hypothetical protein